MLVASVGDTRYWQVYSVYEAVIACFRVAGNACSYKYRAK